MSPEQNGRHGLQKKGQEGPREAPEAQEAPAASEAGAQGLCPCPQQGLNKHCTASFSNLSKCPKDLPQPAQVYGLLEGFQRELVTAKVNVMCCR